MSRHLGLLLLASLVVVTAVDRRAVASPANLRMAIVLDDSGSMKRTDPHRLSVTAAMIAIQLSTRGDRVALVPLNRQATRLLPGGADRGLLRRLQRLRRSSAQTIYDRPLRRALTLLGGGGGARQAVLFLTDGRPDPGPGGDAEAILRAQSDFLDRLPVLAKETSVYPVLLGDLGQTWRSLFSRAAQRTRGRLFVVSQSGDQLVQAFADIYADQLGSKVVVLDLEDGQHTLASMDDFLRFANVVVISRGGAFSVRYPGRPLPGKVYDNGKDGPTSTSVYHFVDKLKPSGPADLKITLKGGGSYRALLIWDYDLLFQLDAPRPNGAGGYDFVARLTRRTDPAQVVNKQAFLKDIRAALRICSGGKCRGGEALKLSCKGGRCAFYGKFVAVAPGRYWIDAVARRWRRKKQVLELRSVQRHPLRLGSKGRLRAQEQPLHFALDQNQKAPWRACADWAVALDGLSRSAQVKLDTSALRLAQGVRLRVNGAATDSLVLRPGDRRLQLCLRADRLVDRPGFQVEGRKLRLIAANKQWFAEGGDQAETAARVEIKARTWWNRYKKLLLYLGLLLLLALLLIWIVRGFVSPHDFPEALKVNWGKTIERLDRNEMPVSELRQAGRGFYRNAQLWIGSGRCFLESGWPARARFEATSARGISLIGEDGVELLRVNKFDADKQEPVESHSLASVGDRYKIGDLFVRLKL